MLILVIALGLYVVVVLSTFASGCGPVTATSQQDLPISLLAILWCVVLKGTMKMSITPA